MIRDKIIEVAKTYLGTPYSKLDCSAFVRAVFRQFDYELPRVSDDQAKHIYDKGVATLIDESESVADVIKKLDKGFVVAWSKKGATGRWKYIHHISIYDEDGYNYESSSSKGKVVRRSLWESTNWQIIMIADVTKLIAGSEVTEDMIEYQKQTPRVFNAAEQEYQKVLLKFGYSLPKYGADGKFGDETLEAHNKFQKDNGLNQTNGVDIATQAVIFKKLAVVDNTAQVTDLKKQIEELKGKIEAVKSIVI